MQETVKVFVLFHRFLSLAREVLCGPSQAMMSTWPSNNEDIRMRFYHPTHPPAPLLNDDHVSVTEDVRVQNTFPELLRAL